MGYIIEKPKMIEDFKEIGYIEPRLIEKIRRLVHRCTNKTSKLDAFVICDGDEGYGKTTMSVIVCYIFSKMSGRKFGLENVFFDVDKLIEFATTTKEQIILWDEAALAGLSTEWYNKNQRKLIKLMMVARKKRHFFIFNIPKVFRLSNYLVSDRAIALIHVYARNETELGRFVYYNKLSLSYLYDRFKSSKKKEYKKYYTFRGCFPNALHKIIDEDEYDKMKDEAIMSIGNEEPKENKKLLELKYKIATFKDNYKEVAQHFGIHPNTIHKWGRIPIQYPHILEN